MEEKRLTNNSKKEQPEKWVEGRRKQECVCSGNKNKSFKKDRNERQSLIPLRIQVRWGLKVSTELYSMIVSKDLI